MFSYRKFNKLFNRLNKRSAIVVILLIVVCLIITSYPLYRLSDKLIEKTSVQDAALYADAITEFRTLYTSEVVSTMLVEGITVTHDYQNIKGSIPLPATLSILLGEKIGKQGKGETKLYSPYPFPFRKSTGGLREDFQKEAWKNLSETPEVPFYKFEEQDGRKVLRYAVADIMRPSCVNCHNTHPQTPKSGWKVGDLRGVLEIERPLDEVMEATQEVVGGTILLNFFILLTVLLLLGFTINKWRKSTGRLDKIISSMGDPLVIINQNLIIKRVNESGIRLFGYDEPELIGKNLKLILLGGVENYRRKIRKREVVDIRNEEKAVLSKSGEQIPVLFSATRLAHDEDGSKEIICVFHDITLRKEEEEERKRIVQENSEIKDEFLANVSHEIRTPMNAIVGFTNLLGDTKLDEEQLDHIDSIKIASDNLLTLINDILDFSKIESGKITLEQVPFNLFDRIIQVEKIMLYKADRKGVKLKFDTDANIDKFVIGDPTRLVEILVNLIDNGIKFTEKGIIQVTSTLEKETTEELVVQISVKDTGIGISKDKLEGIFERFKQAEKYITRRYGGTGLGLSISKSLVELQNGTIGVESEEGKGAEFYFKIPYKIIKDTSKLEQTTDEPRVSFDQVKILLVEDHILNQKLVKNYLEIDGIKLDVANNGLEGIDLLRNNNYDIILMDLQMPEMDGYTATKMIRKELKSSIPIIAMTAHTAVGEKEKCLAIGMNDYISKPYSKNELIEKIGTYAKKRNQEISDSPESKRPIGENTKNMQERLEEMANGDQAFINDLIQTFLKDVAKDLSKIKKEFASGEIENISEIAHKLKTSFIMFGLIEAHDITLKLENAKKNGEEKEIENYILKLDKLCGSIFSELRDNFGKS